MNVPDFLERSDDDQDKCGTNCLANCSCLAHAYDPGVGCMHWSKDLIDLQKFQSGGVDLYIRVPHSELGKSGGYKRAIIVVGTIGPVILAASAYLWWRKWTTKHTGKQHKNAIIGDQNQDLPLFYFKKLVSATNGFHSSNMLGKGGFGQVYKGQLEDGQEIAVKRLSKASSQGLEEFMNEVVVISKLQHRNLVRLLGCCIEGDEQMLIYELMPNKSLDAFLFGLFSEKSDVYSFGVLLLEIVSARRNTSFYNNGQSLSLVGFAWKLWNEGKITTLIDPDIWDPLFESSMLRCIHIGLLCVQELTSDRPTMSTIVLMLTSEI